MNDADRDRQLAHIRDAIAEADKPHTPEELAAAAHALEKELEAVRMPAQASLVLRTANA
jgi:hypothetical protein